ncbi:helix-turn-helix domain-containing protein [Photobacterium leiognathi subsp. mandapamensis]
MLYTEKDRQILHDTWMSYKAKMRITQIEMAKKLGLTQLEFSDILRGSTPIEQQFVNEFCGVLGVEPILILPSLRERMATASAECTSVKNTFIFDGEITNVKYSGNQLVVEYEHRNATAQ